MKNTQRYSLRNISRSDLSTIFSWRNSEEIRQMMKNDELIKWENHISWYEKLYCAGSNVFKIFSVDDALCGTIVFQNITEKNVYWGFYIGESKEQSKGLATIMAYLGIDYIFANYSVDTIVGEVLSFNEGSKKFHEKMGFELAAVQKQAIKREEVFYDLLIYILSREKWRACKIKFKYILDYDCEIDENK